MKIVYLSKNMGGYQSSSYQQDVMDELSKHANVFFMAQGLMVMIMMTRLMMF